MSTNKPRIQAYIDVDLYNQFEVQRTNWGVSQSQALERILADRFRCEQPREGAKDIAASFEHEFTQYTFKAISELQNQVGEIQNYLIELRYSIKQAKSQKSSLLSELSSESESNLPSESESNLPSESELVTSESELVTSESESSLPSESESSLPSELDSNLPSESESNLPSESESNLPSESELVTSESELVTSESELVTSESESNLLSELDSNLLSELPQAELDKFVICEIDKQLNRYSYWAGNGRGFVGLLELAKRYKSENTIDRPMKGILEDADYSRFKEEPNRFELRYNPVRFFVEKPQPKGKILAKV